jgi:molybdenum cofactor biosynthesis protein B
VTDMAFALVTVSDTRTAEDDTSGALMEELVRGAGHRVVHRCIVKDDAGRIRVEAESLMERDDVDAVVLCGGTGISRRDVTVESVRPLFEKELTGFGEVFRVYSMEDVGSAAMMSRATAGIRGGRVLFCIPGSRGAVRTAFERVILRECGHVLWEARR